MKAIPGKTKRLRGRLAHLIQYDISYNERMHYEVDEENKIVYSRAGRAAARHSWAAEVDENAVISYPMGRDCLGRAGVPS